MNIETNKIKNINKNSKITWNSYKVYLVHGENDLFLKITIQKCLFLT